MSKIELGKFLSLTQRDLTVNTYQSSEGAMNYLKLFGNPIESKKPDLPETATKEFGVDQMFDKEPEFETQN